MSPGNGEGRACDEPGSSDSDHRDGDETKRTPRLGQEAPFSMSARSTRRWLRCPECFQLYAFLDEVQRDLGRPEQGIAKVEEEMGWQTRTAKKHLAHLADVGLIRMDPMPLPGGGWSRIRFIVAHNPARGRRVSRLREIPGVWGKPTGRRKKPSGLEALLNARRDAPSVDPDGWDADPDDGSDDPARQRLARRAQKVGATRQIDDDNALRDAPSVSRSSSESLDGSRAERDREEGGDQDHAGRANHDGGELPTAPKNDFLLPAHEERSDEASEPQASESLSRLTSRDAVPAMAGPDADFGDLTLDEWYSRPF